MPRVTPCFVVTASYVEGAAERRAPYRDEHLERVEKLLREGALLLGGAFDDMSASLLVFGVQSEEAVVAVIESDVYWREGIWTDYTIRKLNRITL